MALSTLNPESVCERVDQALSPFGLETYPFKVGWYNQLVEEKYKLPYEDDTLAFMVISTPDMFEKAFKPFIRALRSDEDIPQNPIDECILRHISAVKEIFPDEDIEILQTGHQHSNGVYKILLQTAAHVASAAFYYQRRDVVPDPWDKYKKMHGICVHPKYGGWFYMWGVIIFRKLTHPSLEQKEPPDVVSDMATRQELLERLNYRWQDGSYKDIIPVTQKYSEEQQAYLKASPEESMKLHQQMRREGGAGAQ